MIYILYIYIYILPDRHRTATFEYAIFGEPDLDEKIEFEKTVL